VARRRTREGSGVGHRRNLVRRFVSNNDRAVALPDTNAPPSPRRGDYDDYQRPAEVPQEPETPAEVPAEPVPENPRVTCPHPGCGRQVRFNVRRSYYYSHTLPGSATTCPQSGRPRAIPT
jgi:hypothetical protein